MVPLSLSVLAAQAQSTAPELRWRQLEDIPDPIGFKGMYGGVSAGHVILAGGSNFPVPQNAGGKKTFHRTIFVRSLPLDGARGWTIAGETLLRDAGEGAAVTTPDGVACLGGHDGTAPMTAAFLLQWNPKSRRIEKGRLPDLPLGSANSAAVYENGAIYVLGGDSVNGALHTVWRLDLSRARSPSKPETAQWESLPAWPGPARFGCMAAVITIGSGRRALWLGGGISGPAKSQADYLRDGYLFDLESRQWHPAAPMPKGAVLGSAVPVDGSTFIVLGGSDGHDFEQMKALGERYRIPSDVLRYNGRNDRWEKTSRMPLGVVGAAVAKVDDTAWLVAGGEYSPGLRTPQVFHFHLEKRADRNNQ